MTAVRCSQCGGKVRARIPKGGDGSALQPYKHLIGGEVCRGTYDLLDASDALDDEATEASPTTSPPPEVAAVLAEVAREHGWMPGSHPAFGTCGACGRGVRFAKYEHTSHLADAQATALATAGLVVTEPRHPNA